MQGQVATGGLHGVWKIFSARSKKEGRSPTTTFPRKAAKSFALFPLFLAIYDPKRAVLIPAIMTHACGEMHAVALPAQMRGA